MDLSKQKRIVGISAACGIVIALIGAAICYFLSPPWIGIIVVAAGLIFLAYAMAGSNAIFRIEFNEKMNNRKR
jgi:ABC-type Mn2+/Zn2+ transport system permease subunit